MANVKISQLPPTIEGNLVGTALLPIVNTNGIFTTDKITVNQFANYILLNAGNTLANANISSLSYNVINAAQPNVTSIGTLSNLTVVGTSNVGYPNNLIILGGTNGQVLTTNGSGGLSWTTVLRSAYGLVAADVVVTLDDLQVSVTSRLKLQLTTGSWQGAGWTETFTSDSQATTNWANLSLSTGFSAASGIMNNQGDGCRCVISDQTPSAKVYCITVVRSGTSGNLWNISIERLV